MGIELAIAGASLVGGLYASRQQGKAAGRAADAQSAAAQAGVEEQRRQFEAIQKLMSPYVTAGTGALAGQQDLTGLNGNDAQRAAIQALQQSPQFTSMLQQGESSILANASATGGLRGGNTQAALAQFSPQLLSQVIEQQYGRLGGMASMGQNAAAGVGNAGMNTGNQVTQLLQQQGAAQAGGLLAQGKAQAGYAGSITGALGMYGGFGNFANPNMQGNYNNPAGETGNYRGTVLPNGLRGGF